MGVHPLGQLLKRERLAAGLSLRSVADHLGISHVTYGEVERGVKASLARKHWAKLMEIMPTIVIADLERESLASQTVVQLQLRNAPQPYRDLAQLLRRSFEEGQFDQDDEVTEFLRALRRRRGPNE